MVVSWPRSYSLLNAEHFVDAPQQVLTHVDNAFVNGHAMAFGPHVLDVALYELVKPVADGILGLTKLLAGLLDVLVIRVGHCVVYGGCAGLSRLPINYTTTFS